MQAVQFARYGGPEVLVMADQPSPSRAEGERLIEVHAVSVNPIDWKLRSGLLKPLPGRFPATTGRDGAGIVTQVAAGEDESLVGARICFLARGGLEPGPKSLRCQPLRLPSFRRRLGSSTPPPCPWRG
jgi:NADPH:quinone reductase-like Zn-dependent oxidoreductase